MLQQRINRKARGMNLLDYCLLGGGVLCTITAIGDFGISGNDWIFLAIAGLCFWFALDGVKANWRDAAAIVLLLVMLLLISANLEPYAAAAYALFNDKLPAQILSQIPIIGGIWTYFAGGLVLAAILCLEVYPSILMGNRQSIKYVIDILKKEQSTNPSAETPDQIARLEAKYANFALETYNKFQEFRIYAYLVDFCFIVSYYPPLKEGWASLKWGAPGIDELDWANIAITIVILVGLQSIVVGYLWVRNINEYFVRREEH